MSSAAFLWRNKSSKHWRSFKRRWSSRECWCYRPTRCKLQWTKILVTLRSDVYNRRNSLIEGQKRYSIVPTCQWATNGYIVRCKEKVFSLYPWRSFSQATLTVHCLQPKLIKSYLNRCSSCRTDPRNLRGASTVDQFWIWWCPTRRCKAARGQRMVEIDELVAMRQLL